MSLYRERHKVATWALDEAREKARNYSLPDKVILFKKIDKNGNKLVGFKNFEKGNFELIKRDEVNAMGVDIDALPEYTEFSERYRELKMPADDYFRETKSKAVNELRRAKKEMLRPYYLMRRRVYDEYMDSEEWQNKRKHVFAAQGSDCIDCGCRATDVHHLHYETLGDECPINDLVPLCRECHGLRHALESIEI